MEMEKLAIEPKFRDRTIKTGALNDCYGHDFVALVEAHGLFCLENFAYVPRDCQSNASCYFALIFLYNGILKSNV